LARSSSDLEAWPDYVQASSSCLGELMVTTADGALLTPEEGFRRWIEMTHQGDGRGQRIYFIGNGASAMMAGHFAADACKNGRLNAMAFNDAALLTAVGGDAAAFARAVCCPLRPSLAREATCWHAISSSGNSPNILPLWTWRDQGDAGSSP
jgi:D-sedoheptulose 7-phosphate isomerase